jgi:azurin
MKTTIISTLLITSLILFTSCTKKADDVGDAAGVAAANNPTQLDTTQNIGSVGETMAYDKSDLTVKSGADITLNFKNNSSTLQHNWVLVKPGTENDVGLAGIKAGLKKSFIPDDATAADIIAHTKLVEPGQSDSVTFKAPAAGDYPYICTNAGHHTVMKGVLHSK